MGKEMLGTDSGTWDQNTDFQGCLQASALLDPAPTPGALGPHLLLAEASLLHWPAKLVCRERREGSSLGVNGRGCSRTKAVTRGPTSSQYFPGKLDSWTHYRPLRSVFAVI